MRIAELARRAEVRVSTVRFYERSGVLAAPARTDAGYRDYDAEALRRLRFLRRGQELGFTLAELTAFSTLSDQFRAGTADAGTVAATARAKVAEIDQRIEALRRTRDAITGLLDDQCPDPAAPCPIVRALGGD